MPSRTLAFVLLPLLGIVIAGRLAAQQLASGFVDEVVVSNLSQPVGMAFLPDGRILVVEQNTARVKVATSTAVGIVGVVPGVATSGSEQGLLGIAVDPSYPAWPYIYLIYNHAQPQSVRVVRYTLGGDITDPNSTNLVQSSPYFILTDPPDAALIHNGGTLRFGPDNMLYVSLGDDFNGCNAQDLEVLAGKILRLDVAAVHGQNGAGPPAKSQIAAPGNPFSGPNSQLVWAYGLRNPFRFSIDPISGHLFVGDVGSSLFEELNVIDAPGLNLGWPLFEGPAVGTSCTGTPVSLTSPVLSYPNVGGNAVMPFGAPYRNLPGALFSFGSLYDGSWFYTDFFQGFMRRLIFDGTSWIIPPPAPGQPSSSDWGTGMTTIPDAVEGTDGALYYVKWASGAIRRIRPDGGFHQIAILSGNGQAGNAAWPLFNDLVVQVTDASGAVTPGVPVTFSLAAGNAQLDPQPVLTDATGAAHTGCILGSATSANPIIIQAGTPGAAPVFFTITWRGLVVDSNPLSGGFTITIRHSQTNAPFTLFAQPPPAASLGTIFGNVSVNLLNPLPGSIILDGLGLEGPPNPLCVTGPVFPIWSLTVPGFPTIPGGLIMIMQAFAVDNNLLPNSSGIMVSNAVTLFVF